MLSRLLSHNFSAFTSLLSIRLQSVSLNPFSLDIIDITRFLLVYRYHLKYFDKHGRCVYKQVIVTRKLPRRLLLLI